MRVGAMAGVAAALTGFFLYVFGMIAEPPMAILYSGLEPREAGQLRQARRDQRALRTSGRRRHDPHSPDEVSESACSSRLRVAHLGRWLRDF